MAVVGEVVAQQDEEARTLASTVYRKLRRDIVAGRLEPNAKLNIKALCERFGSTLSPVREALNRLTPEGLVHQSDNRGFIVAPISIDEMNDLTLARCWMNEMALRDAIEHGDSAWEERVVVSLHRLERTPRDKLDEAQQEVWSDRHREFHSVLISACRSKRLLHYCDEMLLAAERYRRVARRSAKRWLNKVDHREIADATISRKTEIAVDMLNRHFQRTAELVEALMSKTKG